MECTAVAVLWSLQFSSWEEIRWEKKVVVVVWECKLHSTSSSVYSSHNILKNVYGDENRNNFFAFYFANGRQIT